MILLYQRDVTGLGLEALLENSRRSDGPPDEYVLRLIGGVEENRADLDARIGAAARGWRVDRLAPLERNILRVAVQEMLHEPEVPSAVAINEAVEMAKRFCQAEAPAFVNGILGRIATDEAEVTSR
jgi:N utilization substance protein B